MPWRASARDDLLAAKEAGQLNTTDKMKTFTLTHMGRVGTLASVSVRFHRDQDVTLSDIMEAAENQAMTISDWVLADGDTLHVSTAED